ncbi:MAG: hypothetical protein NT052_01320 [Candidatus Shapirobacteria bacterium]|nr:hypothetical protein [Candidatus Shapirobacteria bacterium]
MKILPVFLVLSFIILTSSAFAIGKPNTLPGRPSGIVTVASQPTGLPTQAQNRLTEAKLKACQAQENAITQRMIRLMELVTTMEGKFDAIAQRTKEYYTSKVVPNGKTVTDYDALVTTIQTKKDAVQTALTTAQTNSNGFSCVGNNPKGLLTQFRTDMQAVKKALQDYRTSIKNLIVAVRSVTGTTEKANPSVSPKPTE